MPTTVWPWYKKRYTCSAFPTFEQAQSVLVILQHERRRLISLSVIDHPTADWIARQITEAFLWEKAPDTSYGTEMLSYGFAVARSCCNGHPGPTNGAAIALAEWTRPTAHRLDQTRVPGPRRGSGRSAPAPRTAANANYYNELRTH